ncbi:3-phenylpropionate/cinnamic acid dioxygenase ferredoxin subunit [Candidatus Anstonella stagnisolia]|nr:3-phenylpropionate/cinnamic acid dioxygenase ferredoxin subunit [Candidatus Anstonella stagnisolia]
MAKQLKNSSPWFDSVPQKVRFPALFGEQAADFAVIGGGIVGVMAAWRMAEQGFSVILLEKGTIAGGETGFTTALLTRIPDTSSAILSKKYGSAFVQELFVATREASGYLHSLVKRRKIKCDFSECSSYCCSYAPENPKLKMEWAAVHSVDKNAHFVQGKEARAACPAVAEAMCVEGEARFDVRKFIFGLLEKKPSCLRVFENSEAKEISVSGKVEIRTAGGIVRAKKIILATGVPPRQFELPVSLETNVTFALVANYPKGAPFSDNIFWDTADPYFYFRRLDSHRIILGGMDVREGEKFSANEQHEKLREFLNEKFSGKYTVENEWSGRIVCTHDGLPYIAQHPKYPNVLVATGLGGNGMVMGAMAGGILAGLATGKQNPHAKLFSFSRGAQTEQQAKPKQQPMQNTRIQTKQNVQNKHEPPAPAAKNAHAILLAFALVYLSVFALTTYTFFSAHGGVSFLIGANFATASALLFPLVGLYAFSLLWAQIMIGSNLDLLRKVFPLAEKFHRAEGIAALLFALIHPSMILIGVGLSNFLALNFVPPSLVTFVWLGFFQLLLLICTAGSALLMQHPFLRTRWRIIHYANYLLFASVWIHSWFLGSNVQSSSLKYLWAAFALSVIVSLALRIARARKAVGSGINKEVVGMKGTKYVKVALVKDIGEGSPFCASANGTNLAIFKLNGKFYATENACPHAGGPLCSGPLNAGVVECPWHGSKFDVASGKVLAGPATTPVKTFPVRISGENVEVML